MKKLLPPLFAVTCFTGCNFNDAFNDPILSKTESELFAKGTTAIAEKSYQQAIDSLEALESIYPLSAHASIAQKMLLECYFRKQQYPMLKAAVERFAYENPKDEDLQYFDYLRFISIYYEAFNYPYHRLPIDRSLSDISKFNELFINGLDYLNKYKSSPYAPNVAQRMPYIKQIIAKHYYIQGVNLASRHQYYGAINSLNYVNTHFYDTDAGLNALLKIKEIENDLKKNKEEIIVK